MRGHPDMYEWMTGEDVSLVTMFLKAYRYVRVVGDEAWRMRRAVALKYKIPGLVYKYYVASFSFVPCGT